MEPVHIRQRGSGRRFALGALLALSVPHGAHAQSVPRAPWALISARYDTRTSDFIYALYGYGRGFIMVGMLQNPRSGYTELLGAVGATFSTGGTAQHALAVGVARATESWYAQLYYVPSVRTGPLWLRATSELYLPLSSAGTTQLGISPFSATLVVSTRVEAGLAADVSASQGASTLTAVGPEVRLALPKAVLGVDAQRMLNASGGRARVFFTTAF